MALTVGTNTYIAVTDATAYFALRLNSAAWTGASDADKAAALATASRCIDAQRLLGIRHDSTQVMEFPRLVYSSVLRDAQPAQPILAASGRPTPGWVDIGTPQAVLDAVCEEALWRLSLTATDLERQRLMEIGVVGRSAGDANEYAQQSVVQARARGEAELQSPVARQLMAPYLAKGAAIS